LKFKIDENLPTEYAPILREAGFCLTATFCVANGHALLHRNRDFDAFEQILGLAVIHP